MRFEHFVTHLVIGVHRALGRVVLIDTHDVRKVRADLGQHFLHVVVDAPRLTLVTRLSIERPLGLHDIRREPVDVVGGGLARGEHPTAGADAAREPRGRMRYRNWKQRLDRNPLRF